MQPRGSDTSFGDWATLGDLPSVVVRDAYAVDTQHDLFNRAHKSKIELMVPAGRVEEVVAAIQTAAHTGNPGDGRIFVIPIEDCVLIRTGERGEEAR